MAYTLRSRKLGNNTSSDSTPTLTHPSSNAESVQRTRNAASTSSSTIHTMADNDDPRLPLLPAKQGVPAHPSASLSQQHVSSPLTTRSPDLKESAHSILLEGEAEMENPSKKSQWIVLALASGACAAFNGVFAKLTTTELTTNFATSIANFIGLSSVEGGVEVVVRGLFFALNLIFNGIMWTLFTKALARGTSTTQVSILNTSSNFMITAILGFLIFSEKLPGMWFVGAAMLVAGNVIIGRRDESENENKDVDGREVSGEEGEGLLGEDVEMEDELDVETAKKSEDDDILDLGHDDEDDRRLGPESLRRDW